MTDYLNPLPFNQGRIHGYFDLRKRRKNLLAGLCRYPSRTDRTIRVQRRVNGLETERAALTEEKRLVRELSAKLAKAEYAGLRWKDVIDRWVLHQELYPTKRYAQTTIIDYAAVLRKWTTPWLTSRLRDQSRRWS